MKFENEFIKKLVQGEIFEGHEEFYTYLEKYSNVAKQEPKKLLQLLEVNSQIFEFPVAWIASYIGKDICSEFSGLKALILSENEYVRYEMQDVYLTCAISGKDVSTLIRSIEDSDPLVRSRALDYLRYLSNKQLENAFDFSVSTDSAFREYIGYLLGVVGGKDIFNKATLELTYKFYLARNIRDSTLDSNIVREVFEKGYNDINGFLRSYEYIS